MTKCRYCANQATVKTTYNVEVCQHCYDDIEFNKNAPIKHYYVLVDENEVLMSRQIFFNETQAKHYAETVYPELMVPGRQYITAIPVIL